MVSIYWTCSFWFGICCGYWSSTNSCQRFTYQAPKKQRQSLLFERKKEALRKGRKFTWCKRQNGIMLGMTNLPLFWTQRISMWVKYHAWLIHTYKRCWTEHLLFRRKGKWRNCKRVYQKQCEDGWIGIWTRKWIMPKRWHRENVSVMLKKKTKWDLRYHPTTLF